MTKKKTAVLGASPNPSRYAHRAMLTLKQHGHEAVPLGKRHGTIDGKEIITDWPDHIEDLDTVTIYVGPQNQPPLYDYILKLKPKRLIFNPGAENPELVELAEKHGIETENACTLVLLGTNQY